ncbi:hypothetical protein LTR94_021108 [Friedmanniomyces endolithicus]|nr:hypothetical protein LTR94_021108 [Friedmanniomyces endolithicus]
MAVTKAVEEGSKAIICASTGNTSAAAAAYAARAGIKAFVLIPEGKIAMGKMAQAMMYGAITMQIRGNFDDGMRLVKEIADKAPVTIVNSINPYRLQGQKTIAYEIVDELGRAPDYHCLPVGNAGNITAHWMGYTEAVANQPADQFEQVIYDSETDQFTGPKPEGLPTMVGYQAAGAAPFLRGAPVENPETVATAIRIGNPQSWNHAKAVVRDSQASIGGAIRDIKAGKIAEGSVIVCTVTGNGLKDPDTAIKQCSDAVMLSIDATLEQVRDSILSNM